MQTEDQENLKKEDKASDNTEAASSKDAPGSEEVKEKKEKGSDRSGSHKNKEEKKKAETEKKADKKQEDPLKEAEKKLDEATAQLSDMKDRLMRLMAEFDNYRKRTEKEQAESFTKGERNVVESLLPVIDNFERAMNAAKDKEDPLYKGIEMTHSQMLDALKKLGVEQRDDEGKTFDPAFHNALMHVEDEAHGEGEIVEVFQKGYMMNETVIRPSLVKVAN